MTKLLIDTDCGIDDAVALWWAATQPDVELVGVTTVFGNVALDDAAANAWRILELAGRPTVPTASVTPGAGRPSRCRPARAPWRCCTTSCVSRPATWSW